MGCCQSSIYIRETWLRLYKISDSIDTACLERDVKQWSSDTALSQRYLVGMNVRYGAFMSKQGDCYRGQYARNMEGYDVSHGMDAFEYADGWESFFGEWYYGYRTHGIEKYANGEIYEGDFGFGWEGNGKLVTENGSVYECEFGNYAFEGFGVYVSSNGKRYEGEWSNDRYHGKGKLKYANGDEYEGKFSEGERSGYGEFRMADGTVLKGGWRFDRPWRRVQVIYTGNIVRMRTYYDESKELYEELSEGSLCSHDIKLIDLDEYYDDQEYWGKFSGERKYDIEVPASYDSSLNR